ncbi:MAG: acetyl-CoA acetyltransferase [Pseudomonadales bacterium]|nr:acetyl-CoA acetyltransferase [Pseudomonadales bacterium]
MPDPNTPVIVGIHQLLQRVDDPLAGAEPVDMMVSAARGAAADAGNEALVTGIESVRVIRGVWRYKQPASYVAAKLGVPGAETVGTPFGGNMVQSVVNETAMEILAGRKSLVLITGAENGNSQAKARKLGIELPVTETHGTYTRMIGEDKSMSSEPELARNIRAPIQIYPIFENALRYERGESIEDHVRRISALWASFSEVAGNNPHAWLRDPVDDVTIRTPGPANRMVSFPYPKLMNSNNAVDMAAALVMCSVAKARELGIDEEKWIYPWAGTDAHDHFMVSDRDNLHTSPAIRIAGRRVLELAGRSVDDLDFIDVYSCFPSAVQVAMNEMALPEGRPLTVTGGLTFGGGPLNNYVMHSIARTVELLRASRSSVGLVTANGGYLTKHAFGVYAGEPPARPFQHANVQEEVDATPSRHSVIDHDGEVTIESYTVMYGGESPAIGHAACLLPDGRRTWANTEDRDVMVAMTTEEFCGRRARIDGKGNLTVL